MRQEKSKDKEMKLPGSTASFSPAAGCRGSRDWSPAARPASFLSQAQSLTLDASRLIVGVSILVSIAIILPR